MIPFLHFDHLQRKRCLWNKYIYVNSTKLFWWKPPDFHIYANLQRTGVQKISQWWWVIVRKWLIMQETILEATSFSIVDKGGVFVHHFYQNNWIWKWFMVRAGVSMFNGRTNRYRSYPYTDANYLKNICCNAEILSGIYWSVWIKKYFGKYKTETVASEIVTHKAISNNGNGYWMVSRSG